MLEFVFAHRKKAVRCALGIGFANGLQLGAETPSSRMKYGGRHQMLWPKPPKIDEIHD
jgi:hypothetical protein